jgi:NAD(P)-dependent dehydrogenase (short-subunit alcohol dehydrogenase family)
MRFKDKSVVVTGGAKGIGGATAQAFLEEGARVSVLDLDASPLGDQALFLRCDVSKGAEVRSAVRQVIECQGGIDILVNNAGIQHYGTVTDTTEAEWDRVLEVNLKGAFLCAKEVIPSMLDRGQGVVVNVASVQSFVSQQRVAPYTTSKTALLGLTRSIAVDYAPKIRCVAVCPGTVDTSMLRDSIRLSPDPDEVLQECIQMHPMKRIAKPREVARLILYLSSEDASFITGQAFRIDGGLGLSIGGSKRD